MRHGTLTVCLLGAALAAPVQAAMALSLASAIPSPAPVGTVVHWTANASGSSPGTLWYRFRYRAVGHEFQMIKDYSPDNTLDWTASSHEGDYEIEAAVRNVATGDTVVETAGFQMTSRVIAGEPTLTPTAHPLVFLYSAPPCPEGARMRVSMKGPAGGVRYTPYQTCTPGSSMNFYLAGFNPLTQYTVRHEVDFWPAMLQSSARLVRYGPEMTLTAGAPAVNPPAEQVVQPPSAPLQDGVLLQALLYNNTIATDLYGNLIWYYPGNISYVTRPQAGGYFFGLVENYYGDQSQQLVEEFDLTGMTLLETNAARVNEQLQAMGKRQISSFHHEARRLPDGKVLVLAAVEQMMTGVQGPGTVDVLGDMIIVMDQNLQVVWTWDAFDHLDPARQATLGDLCGEGSCPPFFLSSSPNDWLHGNSVEETPDGNLLYSSRSQDWIIKIDYQGGSGSGGVIWRLGQDGDFGIQSADRTPWFSHQHDPQFETDGQTLTVFDDGNVRYASDPSAHSRGQVLVLDEATRMATLVLNADLGQYSFALGAAQKLPGGNYHFDNGYLSDGSSMSVEVDAHGSPVYALQAGAPAYRTFRMRDLYTP